MIFWFMMPPVTKLLLLGMFLTFTAAIVRGGRLHRRLRRGSDGTGTNEESRRTMPQPNALVELAMAGRLSEDAPEDGLPATSPLTKARFQFLWEACCTDVRSIRRSAVSIALITSIAVVHSAERIYFNCSEDTKYSGWYCATETAWRLMDIASLGLGFCLLLHVTASHFERKLAVRKTRWNYFCARTAETSRD
jgi:hypothetical protein